MISLNTAQRLGERPQRRPVARWMAALAALALFSCDGADETGRPAGPVPSVLSTTPANGAVEVAADATISLTFSEPMDPSSLAGAIAVSESGGPVGGAVSVSSGTATFSPAAPLALETRYTVVVSTGAKSLLGIGLPASYSFTFTTVPPRDTTPPEVVLTSPSTGATDVPIQTAVTASFSERMDPATLTSATVLLTSGNDAVPGTVSASGATVTLVPASRLRFDTAYTVRITSGAKDLAGNPLAADYTWSFHTDRTPDNVSPAVGSTFPASDESGVDVGAHVSATFTEAMDGASLTASSLVVSTGGQPVAGSVSTVGTTATFVPAQPLAYLTTYVARITTEAKDVAGNALPADHSWTFHTAAAPDVTAPEVVSTTPGDGALDAALGQALTVSFSEALIPGSVNPSTFVLRAGGQLILGVVTYAGTTATFAPVAPLAPLTEHTAVLTRDVQDLAGNPLAADFSFRFTTAAAPDGVAPRVIATDPASGATGVPVATAVRVTFSEPMDATALTAGAFAVSQGGSPIAGTVSLDGATATFTPASALSPGVAYNATVTVAAADLAGNPLPAPFSWGFTTAAADTAPPLVTSTSPASGAAGIPPGTTVVATFSEAIEPTTATAATFSVQGGAGPVPATIEVVGSSVVLRPSAPLAGSTTFTATLTGGITDLAGNPLGTSFQWSFTTGDAADSVAPQVVSTSPAAGAAGVTFNSAVSAAFTEAIDAGTVTASSFTVEGGGLPVPGTVSVVGAAATFRPASPLAKGVTYTATLSSEVRDLAGNPLAQPFSWIFTTGQVPDTTAPTITLTSPAEGAAAVPLDARISATFSESMDPATLTTANFDVAASGVPVVGVLTLNGTTATFTPTASLSPDTVYVATIKGGAKDLAGNPVAPDFSWSFTTAGASDGVAPTVLSTTPPSGASGVAVGSAVTATFSEALHPASVTSTTLIVEANGQPITGSVTVSGATITFTPLASLPGSTTHSATIGTGVTDLAGNPLAAPYTWSFTTGVAPDTSPPQVVSTLPAAGATRVPPNTTILATLSEPIDPPSVNTMSFLVTASGATVTGTVALEGTTAIFRPGAVLSAGVIYSATLQGIRDLAGNPIPETTWSFTTGSVSDVTPPQVLNRSPQGTGVATNTGVTVIFSEPLDPQTIGGNTFTVSDGVGPISGTVTYADRVALFQPSSDLVGATTYTVALDTGANGIKDLAQNPLSATLASWSFITGGGSDATAPVVQWTEPAHRAMGIPRNRGILVAFSTSIDPTSLTPDAIQVTGGGIQIAGRIEPAGVRRAIFRPASILEPNLSHTVTVTGVRSLAGNPLASPYTWWFVTGEDLDVEAPTIATTQPPDAATGVVESNQIRACFGEPMDPTSLTHNNLTVSAGRVRLPGRIWSEGPCAVFSPTPALPYATTLTAVLAPGVTDLAGNRLASGQAWTFTTRNGVPAVTQLAPAAVPAGGAGFTLTVTGTHFVASSEVLWNGVALPTTFVSTTEVQASVTTAELGKAGAVQVVVSNPAPGGGLSPPVVFTVQDNGQPGVFELVGLNHQEVQIGEPDRPSLSMTGRYVAFHLYFTPVVRIMVRDTCQGAGAGCVPATILASVSDDPMQNPSSNSFLPSLSGDGRYVAFESTANNLVSGGTNLRDIYLRDTCIGAPAGCVPTTTLVSVDENGLPSTSYSYAPALSRNGRYVAFTCAASLVAADTNTDYDVYVRDTCIGAAAGCVPSTQLVSVATSGAADNRSGFYWGGTSGATVDGSIAISDDGRFIAFPSAATNLVAGDTNGTWDIFLRDTCAGVSTGCTPSTTRVSVSNTGAQSATSHNSYVSMSGDGSLVVFSSFAADLVAGDTNGVTDAFVRRHCVGLTGCTPSTSRVSVASDGSERTATGGVLDVKISVDGRLIAFSDDNAYESGDTNFRNDVYIRDTCLGVSGCTPSTVRRSITVAGVGSVDASTAPALSGDGAFVVFRSNGFTADDQTIYNDLYLSRTGF